jgi:hypothetical protein
MFEIEETNLNYIFFAKYLQNNPKSGQTGSWHALYFVKSLGDKKHRYFIFKRKQTCEDFVLLEPPNFAMSQQTVVYVALVLPKLSENYRIRWKFLEIQQFNCIVPALTLIPQACVLKRACLWLLHCFEETFGATVFVRVEYPA